MELIIYAIPTILKFVIIRGLGGYLHERFYSKNFNFILFIALFKLFCMLTQQINYGLLPLENYFIYLFF